MFKDQVALVTGASRGIGRAIAEELAAQGATVACIATKVENLADTVAAIEAQGGIARAYGCNVGESASVNATVDQVVAELGGVHILVNNAGITRDGLLMRMSDADFSDILQVNLAGAFYFCRAVSRPMMKARYGRIINVSSIVGLHGAAGQVNYAASKAGLVGMTFALAKELGSRNITVNGVAPGFIETDMTSELSEDFKSHVIKTAPAGRLGKSADIAHAVAFFAQQSSSYITGQILTVDGGLAI